MIDLDFTALEPCVFLPACYPSIHAPRCWLWELERVRVSFFPEFISLALGVLLRKSTGEPSS